MAIYDYYKYFDNIEIDVSKICETYNIIYPNNQPQKFYLKNIYSIIEYPETSDLNRFFDDYLISDGERPDQISYKLYNDINLWWINLFINKISFFDFPISDESLYLLSKNLYYSEYKYSFDKYLEILKNYNEKKRKIKVIKPEQINIFLTNIFNNFKRLN